MKKYTFHAYTRGGYMAMWLGTPAVFALGASLVFLLLYALMPDMPVNMGTALLIAAAGLAIALVYHVIIRRKMYHTYTAEIHKDEMILYKDGREQNFGKIVYTVLQEREEDKYRKAVWLVMGQKRATLSAYSHKTFYGLGTKEDVEQMEMAYFTLHKYLPDLRPAEKRKK
jgi:hypothetical protein